MAISSAATEGSRTAVVTASLNSDRLELTRCTNRTASSASPSSISPAMVCSRLLNSCAWARRVSVTCRVRSSSRRSSSSSVRSRSVVTDPIGRPRLAIGSRLTTSTRPALATARSRSTSSDEQRVAHLLPHPELGQRPAQGVAGDVQQPDRLVVDQRHPAAQVQPDHALADAVQHRVPVLHQPGDLRAAPGPSVCRFTRRATSSEPTMPIALASPR